MAVLQQKRDLRPANKGEGDTAGLSAPAQSTSAVQNTAPFCGVQYSPCVPEPKRVLYNAVCLFIICLFSHFANSMKQSVCLIYPPIYTGFAAHSRY